VDAFDDALRVIASLNDAGVDYVLVGGAALNIHGLVRATEDLDVFVRPDPELYRMKKGTVRPIDHADALALRAAFNLIED
jgi:hypothetical protein